MKLERGETYEEGLLLGGFKCAFITSVSFESRLILSRSGWKLD
jgi:hypothetical protein